MVILTEHHLTHPRSTQTLFTKSTLENAVFRVWKHFILPSRRWQILITQANTINDIDGVLLTHFSISCPQQCLNFDSISHPLLPGWFYSSVAWLKCSWKCPIMALCWFSPVLQPSVAVKHTAIEFVHSGRTLNRKEGNSHSFWFHCLTTRLK